MNGDAPKAMPLPLPLPVPDVVPYEDELAREVLIKWARDNAALILERVAAQLRSNQ